MFERRHRHPRSRSRAPRWLPCALGVAAMLLCVEASARSGVHLPGPTMRLAFGAEGSSSAWEPAASRAPEESSSLLIALDHGIGGEGFALTWGFTYGHFSPQRTPELNGRSGVRLRLGGSADLHGWNMWWPGELLAYAETELRSDPHAAVHLGWHGLVFVGLRTLLGYGDTLRVVADVAVAPVIFGGGARNEGLRSAEGRLRVGVGFRAVQVAADLRYQAAQLRQGNEWRDGDAWTVGAALVFGLGGDN